MVQLNADDVIRGLKRLKSIAKQDILASSLAPDPDSWKRMAMARKEKYEALIALVEQRGVAGAFEAALEDYARLDVSGGSCVGAGPDRRGEQQALEVFFKIIGVEGSELEDARTRRLQAQGAR